MTFDEIKIALEAQAQINENFTKLVWEKLVEQNPEFFKAYDLRLKIKEQISMFNYLVTRQAQLIYKKTSITNSIQKLAPISYLYKPSSPILKKNTKIKNNNTISTKSKLIKNKKKRTK
jgi:uncharacterized protein (TIGR01589 family)